MEILDSSLSLCIYSKNFSCTLVYMFICFIPLIFVGMAFVVTCSVVPTHVLLHLTFGYLILSFIHIESFDVVCADHIKYIVAHWIFLNVHIFFPFFLMVCCLLPWNSLPPVCSRESSSSCLLKQVHISVLEQFFSTLPYLIFTHTNVKFILPWFLGTCHSTLSVVTYQDRLAYWQTFATCKNDLLLELFHTHGCMTWLN